jgi:hypothetical protein
MKHRWLLVAAALAVAGCYASTRPGEDAPTDHAADPQPDFRPDVYPDPEQEPDLRPDIYPDPFPDYLPDGPFECPPPLPVWISFTIDGDVYPTNDMDITERCTVTSAGGTEGTTIIELDCVAEDGHRETNVIEVSSEPQAYIYLWSGGEVVFRYVVSCPWWCDRWFSLSYGPGSMMLAGMDAESLAPWGVDPSEWYAPLIMTPQDGLCPWEYMDCSDSERLALDVTFYDTTARIFDQGSGYVGLMMSYQVIVAEARTEHNFRCTDMPTSWFNALFISIPEG